MCNVSDVPYAHVCNPERDRGRRRLAVRQVRAALGCRATGGGRRVRRVDRRSRSRRQAGHGRQSRRGAVPRFADRTAGRQTVTFATGRLEEATLTRAALATPFNQARPLVVPGRLWRAAVVVGDLLAAMAIVLCIPFVILAIGIPIALCVRLLLWIAGLL
jgi:hypothetical protein